MSRNGYLNFIVLQWFFIRRAKEYDDGKLIGIRYLKGVVPLTGWWSNYVYVK